MVLKDLLNGKSGSRGVAEVAEKSGTLGLPKNFDVK